MTKDRPLKDLDFTLHGDFKIVYDSTDHFDFICVSCGKIGSVTAITQEMVRTADIPGSISPLIRFRLVCPHCYTYGQRKMYINLQVGETP